MNHLLLARFSGVPSLIAKSMKDRFAAALSAVMAHERSEMLMSAQALADDGFWPAADDWKAAYRPYVVSNGILQIPVKGVLLHDFPWALGSWATGYLYIARALQRGLADPMVIGIALICDSPGGEVAGCFELVDKIFAARGIKPIRGFAHESAYSAAYAILSAADEIAVSRTGGVANIGVVTMHVDYSGALDLAGIKITFIDAPEGGHKIDGNPYEALPASVKARWQAQINDLYEIFVASVARNRDMSPEDVRATKALDFTAPEAVENGLADSIAPLDDAVAAFNADLSSADEQGEDEMNDKANAGSTVSKETHDAAVTAARTEGQTAGKADGVKEGTTAERARIGAILGCDEAKERGSLASHLAFETDMTADAAKAMLAKSAKEAAAPVTATIAARTNGQGADVALGGGPIKTPNAANDGWDAAADAVNKQFGIKK